jgi:MFS family permease
MSRRWFPVRGSLWSNRDFLCLWAGQTVSEFGSQVTNLALPFVAILVLKATTFEVAALGVVDFLPFVLLSLPVGVWVDRWRRRPILIAADWGRAVVLGSVPVAYALGILTLWQLFAVGFLAGALTVFFDVAYQSFLPSLVERDQLADGNSMLEISRSTSQVAGPGLAGLLVAAIKAPYAIAVDALSFVVSAVMLNRIQQVESVADLSGSERRMRTEILDGLRYVLRHPLMRPMMLFVAISNFFTSLVTSILLVFAVRRLHLSAATVGLIFSLGSIGSLAGAVVASRVARALGIGPALIGLAAMSGVAWLFIPLASGEVAIPFLVLAQLVFGFCAVASNITGISLLQAITPDRLLGRMNASRRFVVWGVIPFGGLAGGALGSYFGLRPTLWLGAVGASVAFMPLVFSPYRRIAHQGDAEELVHKINEDFLSAITQSAVI